jgi:hypothetical protein
MRPTAQTQAQRIVFLAQIAEALAIAGYWQHRGEVHYQQVRLFSDIQSSNRARFPERVRTSHRGEVKRTRRSQRRTVAS